jgi:hypothetical protein
MATQNAIDANKPIGVDDGGTGAATLTDHGVLVGSGTSPITALAVGSTGTLLVGATTADPAFATSADGNFTFTSATADVTRVLTVQNTDNSGFSTASARLDIIVGGENVRDPQVKWAITGGDTFSAGIDNNDFNKFKISASATLGTTDAFVCTTAGEITKPLQPAFLATLSTTQTNVTGTGTQYTIICNTEIFDQGSDYNNATGVFTAPITGRYFFCAKIFLTDCTVAIGGDVDVVTSNRAYQNGYRRAASTADILTSCSWLADMDLGDTAHATARGFGEAGDTQDLAAVSGSDTRTCFSGYLAL